MYTCLVAIEFDPDKAKANLRKHRVSFADAELVLYDPNALTFDDPDAESEHRFITLGMDALSRVLVVVHSARGKKIRLISARKASPGEVETYYA